MSKSSISSVKRRPPRGAARACGMLSIHAEDLTIETTERVELVDLTDRLAATVHGCGVREGLVNLWSMHTTCGVFINEAQAALHADIKRFLEQTVARDGKWLHNDPDHSDCDRMNADAHLRAMLLGHSLTVQIGSGELLLGQWQRVLAAELDGPRSRTIRVHIQGLS
jgi:secondary thiamine-phosphate synthase enzyme